MEQKKHQQRKTPWEFFVNNRKFTIVLSLAITVLGLISVFSIPKESSPQVDIPVAVVSTSYTGADPESVEKLVTSEIEEEITGINRIKEMTSKSYQGFSSITVEFEVGVDKDKKVNGVEDAVETAKIELPDDAGEPRVSDITISEVFPVLRFSLSGPYDVNRLKEMAEDLKEEIKSVPNVSQVNIQGGQERQFSVIVNKASLDHYGLSLPQVTQAIKNANSDIPIGSIQTSGSKYNVSLRGQINSAKEIEKVPITSLKNAVVYIKDVAEVKDTFKDRESISRVGINGRDSQPAVSLSVIKTAGGNILDIVSDSRAKIEKAKGNILPNNVKVEIIDDQAKTISKDIKNLGVNGIETVLIILVLLMLFVGWREAISTALAVPLTFFISFIALNSLGYTLNFLSIFALILSLGILVDSIIVITEGINRKLKESQETKEATINTLREYSMPLTAGTLTTVFAFLPMLLTSGLMGEFIKALPITVTFTLISALFVSLGILTSLSVKWLKVSRPTKGSDSSAKTRSFWLDEKVLPYYLNFLKKIFSRKRYRIYLFGILMLLFTAALSLPATGILKQDLFPEQDQDYFAINIEEPVGTPLFKTSKTSSEVEEVFSGDDRVSSFRTNIGSSFDTSISGAARGEREHLANIIVNLKDNREQESFEIAREYREKINKLNFFPAEVQVEQLKAGPASGAPITVNITGPSLNTLDELSAKIKTELENIPGSTNIEISKKEATPQFAISIDRAKASLYGVNTNQIAGILRNAISGSEATVVRGIQDDAQVEVKYDMNKAGETEINPGDINSLTLATPEGDIPLSTFAEIKMEPKRAFIEHKNSERIVKVTGESTEGESPITIANTLKKKIDDMDIPPEYQVVLGGEKQDVQESFNDMLRALILGVFAIAMLMVLQFKSFRQPIFIIISIPLAVIGIFPGLVIVGQPLSFPGVIGIVALAGIVVNNAILLIDAINQRRLIGYEKTEAIIKAAKIRFQPILLTATTTIGGMIPLAFSNPTWAPIAYSIIFGLAFSTVLTLIVVPTLYFSWGEKELQLEE